MAVGDELYLRGDANRDKSVRLLEVADTDGDGVPDHRLQVERDGRWIDSTLLNPASGTLSPASLAAGLATATGAAAIATTLVGLPSAPVTEVQQSLAALLSHVVTPERFGAIGDGTNHPLSERYATLAAAQAKYSFVTALTQSIDWAAFQAASNYLDTTGGIVEGNIGANYYINDTVLRTNAGAASAKKKGIFWLGRGATITSAVVNGPLFKLWGCKLNTNAFIQNGGFSSWTIDGTPGSGTTQDVWWMQGVYYHVFGNNLVEYFDGTCHNVIFDTNISSNPDLTSSGNNSLEYSTYNFIAGYVVYNGTSPGAPIWRVVNSIIEYIGHSAFFLTSNSWLFQGVSILLAGYVDANTPLASGSAYGIEVRPASGTVVRLRVLDCEIQYNLTGHIALSNIANVIIDNTRFIWGSEPAAGGGTKLAPDYGIRLAEQGSGVTCKNVTCKSCIVRIDNNGTPAGALVQFDATANTLNIEVTGLEVQNNGAATGLVDFAGHTASNANYIKNYRLSTTQRMYSAGRPPVYWAGTWSISTVNPTTALSTGSPIPFDIYDTISNFCWPIGNGVTFTGTQVGGILTTVAIANAGNGTLVPNQSAFSVPVTGGGGSSGTILIDTDARGFATNPRIGVAGTGYSSFVSPTVIGLGGWDSTLFRWVFWQDGIYEVDFVVAITCTTSELVLGALYKATTIGGTMNIMAGVEDDPMGTASGRARAKGGIRQVFLAGESVSVRGASSNVARVFTGTECRLQIRRIQEFAA